MNIPVKNTKVYGVFVGSIYEGGSTVDIYKDKNIAILEAGNLVDQEKRRMIKAHPVDSEMYGKWEEVPGTGSTIKAWRNNIKEILIYEYELK